MKLNDGQFFTFDLQDIPGTTERVRLPHPEILNTLRVGDILLLDDGKLSMTVTNTTMALLPENEGSVTCQVVHGGMLSNKKGVNTPSVVLPISPLTPKDRRYNFQFRLCDIYFFIDVVECDTRIAVGQLHPLQNKLIQLLYVSHIQGPRVHSFPGRRSGLGGTVFCADPARHDRIPPTGRGFCQAHGQTGKALGH